VAEAAGGAPVPPVDLSGRRILVTGGTAGAGRAFVEAFRAAGAAVGVLGRDAARLTEVADTTGAVGRVADVSDHDATATAVAEIVGVLGGLDGLINNAGLMLHSPPSKGQHDDWARMISANLLGVMHATTVAASYFGDGGGDIINVGSTAAERVSRADFTVYSASKAALRRLTEGFRLDYGERGVRVVLVNPGLLRTGWTAGIRDAALREDLASLTDRRGLPVGLLASEVARLLGLPRTVYVQEITITPFPA